MNTTFVGKPSCLKDVLNDSDAIRRRRGGKDADGYYVAAEKHLTAPQWRAFTANLLADRDWIAAFAAQDYRRNGELTACLRVTGDGSELALLIDPSGYGYARYVGVERTPEPAPLPSHEEKPAPKHTVVIKVWRGLVSEVYASDPDTQIIVVDEDTDDETPDDMPTHQVY
jgi:hypothetical protein